MTAKHVWGVFVKRQGTDAGRWTGWELWSTRRTEEDAVEESYRVTDALEAAPEHLKSFKVITRRIAKESAMARKVRQNPRRMPQAAIDRNVERDLQSIRGTLTDAQMRQAAVALTWFRFHEMSMLADWMVDSIRDGRFARDFYVDDRVAARGKAYSAYLPPGRSQGVGRREMSQAVLALKRLLRSR